jgi:hypothetical protein
VPSHLLTGKGLEECLHTAALPSITVAIVRLGVGVRTDDYLPLWQLRVGRYPVCFQCGLWYVDDLNECSNRRTYESDMNRVDDEVRTLLGPGSVAADKDKSGRQLDMIGWLIDLDAQLVTISDRNFDKTVHAFFSFNINEPITLHQVQVMGSLASRYTQISVLMKVHVCALYEFHQTFRSHSARRKLTDSAHLEVLIWRAFLLSLRINPASFARPFSSFRVRPVSHTTRH